MKPTLIIAEAGVNHNGDPELAHKLVDVAKEIGVDIIKFQTFQADKLTTAASPKAAYQKITTGADGAQIDIIRKLELAPEVFVSLKKHCDQCGVRFLSTAFDLESVDFLHGIGVGLWKIASGEITNLPYLRKIGRLGEKVILSTGTSNLGDVEAALDVLEESGTPANDITLLHCTTEYPAPMAEVNLRAMLTLGAAFPNIGGVGYSDHTKGTEISIAAVAMGACVIEKHFTLDRKMEGPDHKASIEPDVFAGMVQAIRNVQTALGSGLKRPTISERPNQLVGRKSLVALTAIKKGDVLSETNMTVKRPGTGISPMLWDQYCGRLAVRDYEADEII